jgi:hypothetical protein
LTTLTNDVELLIAIVNSLGRHKACQSAPFLLPSASLPPPCSVMDPNVALSLLTDTPRSPPTTNPSQDATSAPALTPNQHELHTRSVKSGAMAVTAQQAPVWIPPNTWGPSYRRDFIYRAEDLICPRCAPWGAVCSCSPRGSGNPKMFKVSQLCCTIL